MRSLAIVSVLALLWAGCAEKATPLAQAPPEPTGPLVVEGVVVDPAIHPLSGVRVVLEAEGVPVGESVTGPDGAFAFEVDSPGAYFLKATKTGFFRSDATVEVRAGGEAEPVRLVLLPDPETTPAIQAFTFHGYLECSATAFAVRLALCSMPDDLVLSAVCDQTGQCMDNVTNDSFLAVHEVQEGIPQWVQSEMAWESTQAFGEWMRAIPGVQNPQDGTYQDIQPYEGPSPLVMPTNGTIAHSLGVGNGRPYQVRVFASYMEETQPPVCLPNPVGCPWGVGFAFEQEFEVFTHVFFGFRPRAGWQFSVDGEHPLPS